MIRIHPGAATPDEGRKNIASEEITPVLSRSRVRTLAVPVAGIQIPQSLVPVRSNP